MVIYHIDIAYEMRTSLAICNIYLKLLITKNKINSHDQ